MQYNDSFTLPTPTKEGYIFLGWECLGKDFTEGKWRYLEDITLVAKWEQIVVAQEYDKKAGIGTITATMIPYSVLFLVFWTLLLVVWLLAGLPIGPGIGIAYTLG